MDQNRLVPSRPRGRGGKEPHRFRELLQRLLFQATRGFARSRFLRQACGLLLEFSGCDEVEVRLDEAGKLYRCRALRSEEGTPRFDCRSLSSSSDPGEINGVASPEVILQAVLSGHFAAAPPFFTRSGSFWTGDAAVPILLRETSRENGTTRSVVVGGPYQSMAVIPIPLDDEARGVLHLASQRREFFTKEDVQFYEAVGDSLGVTISHQSAQWALRERVKELTCLYGIAKLAQRPDLPLEKLLGEVVELLLPSWQYPDMTYARIALDDVSYATDGYEDCPHKQSAEILVRGKKRGLVEVVYTEQMPEMDEGPFLKEERHLLDKVAEQLGSIIEVREADREKESSREEDLSRQRLALVEEMAAGAADRLGEPLEAVLGSARSGKQQSELPAGAREEFERIEVAAARARELVERLRHFARPSPPRRRQVDLDALVGEGLADLKATFAEKGIELARELCPDLPAVPGDPMQLRQVVEDLLACAVRAMPNGGSLGVETRAAEGAVVLAVSDSGPGMLPEELDRLFVPFTTRSRSGLSLARGIAAAHGGSLRAESEAETGTRFELRLPLDPPGKGDAGEGA